MVAISPTPPGRLGHRDLAGPVAVHRRVRTGEEERQRGAPAPGGGGDPGRNIEKNMGKLEENGANARKTIRTWMT